MKTVDMNSNPFQRKSGREEWHGHIRSEYELRIRCRKANPLPEDAAFDLKYNEAIS